GLAAARWPGRLERFARGPLEIVLDGAHNPQGAEALARALGELWPRRRLRLVFGVLSDKEPWAMLRALFPLATTAHLAPPGSPRARAPAELLDRARALCPSSSAHETVREAYEAAMGEAEPGDVVLACGSLYLVGEIRALLTGS
ncbi:MAG: glutamate ligase domain-containing protein, partial [Deltaproteobacteria bacterium]